MTGLLKQRLVMVMATVTQGGLESSSIGTGYFVTGDLVLTASHVVPEQGLTGLEVRTQGDGQWHAAELKPPDTTVVITGITPRNDNIAVMPVINRANQQIAKLADGKKTRYININEMLALPNNQLHEGMANDGLHLTVKAYQVWADALKPIYTEILGAPAAVDHAPPPTGDPSAQKNLKSP
jgi:hypothetical protein